MKIWFDLTNSPHVHFFRDMITELKNEGHEVLVTTRDQANTVDLLNVYGIEYRIVGKSYGKRLRNKILGNLHRVCSLARLIGKEHVDIGISQSSFSSPIAGFVAHVPTIYTNDNEHALGNKVAFLFAKQILIPEFIPVSKVVGLLVPERRVSHYPGVKEGIYLWRSGQSRQTAVSETPKVYFRPEPYFAQYYKGKINACDTVLVELKGRCEIIVLPRDKSQIEHFEQPQFDGITVCHQPKKLDEIARDCTLFIGAGGTMTREMAVLGIPTISVYQDQLLDVDRYLIDNGLMSYCPSLKADDVIAALQHIKVTVPSKQLLDKGREAYQMIKERLLTVNK